MIRRAGIHARALFGATLFLLLSLAPLERAEAGCSSFACLRLGETIASADGLNGALSNVTLSALVDWPVALSGAQWDTLSGGSVEAGPLLDALAAELGVGDADQALAAPTTLLQLFDSAAAALVAGGKTAEADAVAAARSALAGAPGIAQTVRFGDLLYSGATRAALSGSAVNLEDLVMGAAQLFNYEHGGLGNTAVSLTPYLTALGLDGIVEEASLQLRVVEPPTLGCGPVGTVYRTAALRTKLDIALVPPTPLGGTTVEVSLAQIQLYMETGQATASISAIDPAAGSVSVLATHSAVSAYLGSISDQVFFDRTRPINPVTDLDFATVGQASVPGVGVYGLRMRASADADDNVADLLSFTGPYPQTRTATSGSIAVATLITDPVGNDGLLETLEVELVDDTGTLPEVPPGSTVEQQTEAAVKAQLAPLLTSVFTGLVDPLLAALGVSLGETKVTVEAVGGRCSLDGYVYEDQFPADGVRGEGEDWSGGVAVRVNLVRDGVVVASLAVDPGVGAFAFADLAYGSYQVLVTDDPAATAGVAPPGWRFVDPASGARGAILPEDTDTPLLFGLTRARVQVAGLVFRDTGGGASSANDGLWSGEEAGIAAIAVAAYDQASGTLLFEAVTDAEGNFALFVPETQVGQPVVIVAEETDAYLETGGMPGTTGGSYDPVQQWILFTPEAGRSAEGAGFGLVPRSTLAPDGEAAAAPGTTYYFPHRLVAGSAGEVTLSVTAQGTAPGDAWQAVPLRDADCSAAISAGDGRIDAPFAVTPGGVTCLLVKVFVPAGAAEGARQSFRLEASVRLNDTLVEALARSDALSVAAGSGALVLVKSVDRAQALPGDLVVYTIAYRNTGASDLTAVVVRDSVPAFTGFVAAACGPLGAGLSACRVNAPAAGRRGAVVWEFDGVLAPQAAGEVTLTVKLDGG